MIIIIFGRCVMQSNNYYICINNLKLTIQMKRFIISAAVLAVTFVFSANASAQYFDAVQSEVQIAQAEVEKQELHLAKCRETYDMCKNASDDATKRLRRIESDVKDEEQRCKSQINDAKNALADVKTEVARVKNELKVDKAALKAKQAAYKSHKKVMKVTDDMTGESKNYLEQMSSDIAVLEAKIKEDNSYVASTKSFVNKNNDIIKAATSKIKEGKAEVAQAKAELKAADKALSAAKADYKNAEKLLGVAKKKVSVLVKGK